MSAVSLQHLTKCAALWLAFGVATALADVRLPLIFSDHMVLQLDMVLPIWGWAEPEEEIIVALSGEKAAAKADASGHWRVNLGKLSASREPQTLTVKGRNTITVQDILIGEVWLASGQSNMEMQIKGKQHGAVDHADEEIAAANHPGIRMFVRRDPFDIYKLKSPSEKPQEDVEGQWQVCSPETVAAFSAVGYFFARELENELDAPVGIIAAAVGGTPIEAWTSMEAQMAVAPLKPMLDDWSRQFASYHGQQDYDAFMQAKTVWIKQRAFATKSGQPIPKAPKPFKNLLVMKPAGLFNAEIAPLIPYALRGVIWYQGERNAAGPFTGLYGEQLATLIHDWRARWGGAFYFAWVQLPRFKAAQKIPSVPNDWGVSVRDEMRKALRVPNTGMAITIDMGGVTAGHPTNKADYAHRLALLALHDVYHKASDECSGPLFRSVKTEKGRMIISFDHAEGLKSASGEELKGFAIAGQDQKFVWAKAEIHGDKVMVSNEKVPEPAAVRYGWASNPPCNLMNAANLPASPFRTDDWK